MKRAVLSLLMAATIALPTATFADTGRVEDARDREGPLDLKFATHGHRDGRLSHRIGMHDGWRSRVLAGRKNWIGIWISTNEPARVEGSERFVQVDYKRGRGLHATVYRGAPGELEKVGSARVHRLSDRVVRVTFSRRLLGRGVDHYKWFIESSAERSGCGPGVINEGALSYGSCGDTTNARMH